MPLFVIARAQSSPQSVDKLAEAMLRNRDASRREPGCLRYEVARSAADPLLLITIEEWRDRAAFDRHMQTPHVAELLAAVPDLVAAAPEIAVFDPLGA
ncbi:MAG: putative quinol monooxygenase [Planctomycetota bacterium]